MTTKSSTRRKQPKGCPPTGCQSCRHCIPDPHNNGKLLLDESGKVCDLCAPMMYGVISTQDLTGWGSLNCQGGKPCKHYEKGEEE